MNRQKIDKYGYKFTNKEEWCCQIYNKKKKGIVKMPFLIVCPHKVNELT